jgi:hypothetical protein
MAAGGMASGADAVTAAADELYGLPLEEFIAVRTERAKQARGRGDRDVAAAIGKLAKPNTVGWLANQLVRHHGEEIGPLLELGEAMRQATAMLDADQLRQLSRQQRQLVQALVRKARDLAAGQVLSDSAARGLADTLHAALADEQAARQLSQGRLTSGLAHSGFPGIAADAQSAVSSTAVFPTAVSSTAASATAVSSTAASHAAASHAAASHAAATNAPSAKRTATPAAIARQRDTERARREEDDARSVAGDAAAASAEALAALARADQEARAATAEVDRLQAGLDAAAQAQAAANRARRQAQLAADQASRVASAAERRLNVLTTRREKLEE